ncbi:MAG TPA: chloride channel protein [Terracidiphilus sp.]|nr:chloride channel protein [Terracidiphilus sp.]
MRDVTASSVGSSLPSTVALSALGAVFGGTIAALLVVGFTEMLKAMLAVVSRQNIWILVLVPLLGLALSVLVLYRFGLNSSDEQGSQGPKWAGRWRSFPPDAARSHLTDDMVSSAGVEERFPWHLAPIRLLAICATVGFGGAMGTEAPAAYIGVATGAALGTRWRRLLRPAAVGGGAAGVAVLMGIPLVGTAYILELGRRQKAPLDVERVTAAVVGGLVGWLLNIWLGVNLIRLVVPKEPPHSVYQAVITALLVGALSGSITALSGAAIYRAKAWKANPALRLAIGGMALGVSAIFISMIASPSAAIGPGGGAITWVESATGAAALTVLAVDVLRAVATTASSAAGGCGGLFVPFLAIGDLAGRVFAPSLEIPSDLAGAAGAAGGISGGYHLPFTAVALVLSQGGPSLAVLTCLTTVVVAAFAGTGSAKLLDRILSLGHAAVAEPIVAEDPYSF